MTCIIPILLLFCFSISFHPSESQQTWIRAGYWDFSSELPVSYINSALFTHLISAFAHINSSTYQLYITDTKKNYFSTFTSTIREKNPSVVSLLSVRIGGEDDLSIISSMVDQSSRRESFIQSSISTARSYGFDGLELYGVVPSPSISMTGLGDLFREWRDAVYLESRVSGKSQLLLAIAGRYLSAEDTLIYPVDSIRKNLDWVHIIAYDYYEPTKSNSTAAHAALYGNPNWRTTDKCVKEWLRRGLPANKMVLGVPYHGYAWLLQNRNVNEIGAPALGPVITKDGSVGYKIIKSFSYGAAAVYNSTFAVNFLTVGQNWINFDDVETIKAKVSYAMENKLAGYSVFQLSNDDNWVLSRAAQGVYEEKKKKRWPLVIMLPVLITAAGILLFLGIMIRWHSRRKALMSKATTGSVQQSLSATECIDSDAPNVQLLSLNRIRRATNDFSDENKIGEGGFGAVYKGVLPKGKEVAVKRLSETSHQGSEEFRNEVSLTALLQHVNLLKVIGFCTEKGEKMLIYEYMPNKSLDFFLYDPLRCCLLDWSTRTRIIDGIIQGLLYLQEYSNFRIVHRDIKASNILLDELMNPKISDFGMARLFRKDEVEANTGRIVGTYGYVPPEYVRKGVYSLKYDVYSFGVLLVQIVSGKRSTCLYGSDENLSLLEYAYELWTSDQGMELIDPSLDDSSSSLKTIKCIQVALLCAQENPLDRPSMLEVSYMLKNETTAIATPKRPAFSVGRDEEDGECSLRNKAVSVDDATISQLVPR